MKKWLSLLLLCWMATQVFASAVIQPGAARLNQYLPLLMGKRVAVFANHTSLIGQTHLVDVLRKHHVQIVKIFAPEHGFRGDQDAPIQDAIDKKTAIPIISLYGKKLKPSADDLQDVDLIVFDIQDVGVRFYTYISSLQKLMEAAVANHKPLIILDRPNPNGYYVDGPVLDKKNQSFTGMQAVPIVYGMTMGEYARMLVGEGWLSKLAPEQLAAWHMTVIPCSHYTHKSFYVPPVKPSPNLPDIQSIYLYPSIGVMEATVMSVGRGTDKPFQWYGHPAIHTKFTFIPTARSYAPHPPYLNQICHGWNLAGTPAFVRHEIAHRWQLKYVLQAYAAYPDKAHFFRGFRYAAGNEELEEQIKAGMDERRIRQSWEPKLREFMRIREKYLLYADFE